MAVQPIRRYISREEAKELIQEMITPGSDTYAPAFVNIDPDDGSISFDFTGHIHAEGLNLPTHELPGDFITSQIYWTRESDGAQTAWLYNSHGYSEFKTVMDDPTDTATVNLIAERSDTAFAARLENEAGNTFHHLTWTSDQYGPDAVRIMDSNQNSRFVQIGGTVFDKMELSIKADSQNIVNTAANTGGSFFANLPSTPIGSQVIILGVIPGANSGSFFWRADSPTTVLNQATVRYFNADSIAQDPATMTFQFLVITS